MGLKAVVRDGHLRLEEPTDLPEGTVVDLVVDDEDRRLDGEELGRLNAALARGAAQIESGDWVDAEALSSQLEQRSE